LARLYCSDNVEIKHVKEAARLLNKSIVKIEQPDISLDDEEEMMMNETQADDDMNPASTSQELRQLKSLKLSYEEYQTIAKKIVYKLKQEEYKLNEEAADGQAAEESAQGLKRTEIVEWYLKSNEEEGLIQNEDDLIKNKVLCEKVIDRLIKTDHILIALRDENRMEDDEEDLDSILIVHPNYVME